MRPPSLLARLFLRKHHDCRFESVPVPALATASYQDIVVNKTINEIRKIWKRFWTLSAISANNNSLFGKHATFTLYLL